MDRKVGIIFFLNLLLLSFMVPANAQFNYRYRMLLDAGYDTFNRYTAKQNDYLENISFLGNFKDGLNVNLSLFRSLNRLFSYGIGLHYSVFRPVSEYKAMMSFNQYSAYGLLRAEFSHLRSETFSFLEMGFGINEGSIYRGAQATLLEYGIQYNKNQAVFIDQVLIEGAERSEHFLYSGGMLSIGFQDQMTDRILFYVKGSLGYCLTRDIDFFGNDFYTLGARLGVVYMFNKNKYPF